MAAPEVPEGMESPLAFAEAEQTRNTMEMGRNALERQDVVLAFQPVVQGARPDTVVFHEGLIRILDETGRAIPARDFIDSVETSTLGRKIDCLALEMGLSALARNPALRLSINMSARSIGSPQWMRVLSDGLRADATVGERLILEVTESSAMLLPDLVCAFMRDQQCKGISFALDDFGAGHTSFRYLREFYFDLVKIDGQFIRGIAQNPDNQVLTEALMSISRHFDMFTVAESVETAEDATFLQTIGIDCMQGYYFGAPTLQPPWLTPLPQRSLQAG
jgi:EAL domain-containing protein (putative c-di-GMP-specific phosphodiesterase class I)